MEGSSEELNSAWLLLRESCGFTDRAGGRLLWVVYGSERRLGALCITSISRNVSSSSSDGVGHTCGLFWVNPFLLPRLPATPERPPLLRSVASDSVSGAGLLAPGARPRPSSPSPAACVSARELREGCYKLLQLQVPQEVRRKERRRRRRRRRRSGAQASHRAWCCGVGGS
ncbi:hypothetical protein PFLUV_G00149430 [Perca fluviatilis]|uniref:Uncharacterized protein n=1 Tax=Perca fluviatilis TaxID=8168 RepID=A0A6A5E2S9_PERFL|nr:hypothetical protein PFLUV_G00149430 [Perca fluviatilis]